MAYSLKYRPPILSLTISSLLLWTFFGFAYTLDNNTQWGCVDNNSVFSFHNISLSSLSIALLSFGCYYRNKDTGKWLVLGEVGFWIYKLFFLKGGYVIGITASMPISIVLYDLMALTLRFILIKQLFEFSYKSIYFSLVAFLIMLIKVQFFR